MQDHSKKMLNFGTWKAAGKANIGDIYDKMKKSRNQYHYAVRRAEKDLDNIKSNSLNEAASTNNRTFLLELKKTLSKQKTKQKVPDCLEGETTKEGIIEKFRELYSELYNSANTSNEVILVKERFKNMSEQCSKVEVNKINNDTVKQA